MSGEVQIYNTLSRQKEPFVPRREGEVSIYVCGVTPYDEAHLGHARPAIVFDVLRRFLRYLGYRVTLVQNFTDVDDKIIRRAEERNVDPLALSAHYSEAYLRSMDRLLVERADNYPKVSEHIADIIAMIQRLIDNGAAYASGGDVFFRVAAFADYGKLSRQKKEELIAGARIEPGAGKESPLDFALWKAAKEGEPAWESPWGPGRPGWHIECSAMSLKYLGSGFDIHGGGVDLVFPHHENEIAQSEASTGEPFVRYWMHNGLVNFGAEKMSKSLGNFVTVDNLLDKYDPGFLRYAVLQHHYRSPIDFSDEQMEGMKRGWERLNRAADEFGAFGPPVEPDEARRMGADERLLAAALEAEAKFRAAMSDDLNTPAALAAIFELIRDFRPVLAKGPSGKSAGEQVAAQAARGVLLRLAGEILAVLRVEPEKPGASGSARLVDGLIRILVELRDEARKARDFARADRIRDRMKELGVTLEDTPEGTRWQVHD